MSDEPEKNILEFMKTEHVVSKPHSVLTLQDEIDEFIKNLIEKNDGKITAKVWEENSNELDKFVVHWYYHILLK